MAATAVALVNQIKGQLQATRPTFEEMNLNKLSFAKELEFAIQIIAGNDYLAKMDRVSIENSLVNIALSGLTLNPVMKLAYLVPRKGKCCVDPSYQGLVKIVTDTGSVKSIRANVVYEKDTFDIELGSGGYVKHKPYLGVGLSGRIIGAYSLGVLNDGTDHIEWMKHEEIVAIQNRSESVKAQKSSPWDTDWNEMAKKTVVKRHFKYLPKSERALMAAQAIDLDNQINGIEFEKEREVKTLADYIDQPASEEAHIDAEFDEIGEAITNEIFSAPDNKTLKAIHEAHPELHEIAEFTDKLNKRRAVIAQARAQYAFEQQNKPDGTTA